MATIHIIAGPPGIGKSTAGHLFVPPDIKILKKDEMIAENKSFHYKLFAEIAIQKWLSSIRHHIAKDLDFGLELNMGMPNHYDFVLQSKQANPESRLNMVLFFTDDLLMCQERAAKRFELGGHEVNPTVLDNMYHNTIPLLSAYFQDVDRLTLVDIKRNNEPAIIGIYDKRHGSFDIYGMEAKWFNKQLRPFIEDQVSLPTYFISR